MNNVIIGGVCHKIIELGEKHLIHKVLVAGLLGFGGILITATVYDEMETMDGTQFFIVTMVKK
jgi:hypothetical protein